MISVTILTKNSERTLEKTLNSTRCFKDVVILDSGSEDRTLEIAKTYPNVQVHTSPLKGFGVSHNLASSLACFDWIFSLDSDEVLSDALIEEIMHLSPDPSQVYLVERQNYFNGKRIKGCSGWFPDWVARLYHRKTTRFSNDLVHEKILSDQLQRKPLKNPLLHTPYLEICDFLDKMQQYTTLSAEQSKQRTPPFWKILLHSWFAFFKSYILKKGFLAGREGYIISVYNSHTAFYKYLKLEEKTKK